MQQITEGLSNLLKSIIIFSLISFTISSCVKEYDYAPTIILDQDTLTHDTQNTITVENYDHEEIYLQIIRKNIETGEVSIVREYDSPITINNGYYDDYDYETDLGNSYSFESLPISYSCDYLPINYGFRFNIVTGPKTIIKDIYFISTNNNIYYSTDGIIYSYDYISKEIKTILNTGHTSLDNISYSPDDNRLYFSTYATKDLQYYDLTTESLKTDFSLNSNQISKVQAINNSTDYIYNRYGNVYLRSNGEETAIEPSDRYYSYYDSYYHYYTIDDAVSSYVNNNNFILYAEHADNGHYLRTKTINGSAQTLRTNDDYNYKNLSISSNGEDIIYTLDNELYKYYYSSSQKIDDNVTDTDLNIANELLYIKNGDLYKNNVEGTNQVLLLDIDTDIKNISW